MGACFGCWTVALIQEAGVSELNRWASQISQWFSRCFHGAPTLFSRLLVCMHSTRNLKSFFGGVHRLAGILEIRKWLKPKPKRPKTAGYPSDRIGRDLRLSHHQLRGTARGLGLWVFVVKMLKVRKLHKTLVSHPMAVHSEAMQLAGRTVMQHKL